MIGAAFAAASLKDVGLPFWLAAILGIAVVATIAIVMYFVAVRPLIRRVPVAVILATVGRSVAFENIVLLAWGEGENTTGVHRDWHYPSAARPSAIQ